jgi:hypothetical protein
MRGLKTPKKSETLELRLPYETKLAFMARCRSAGVSASEALRGYIADFVEERHPATRRRVGARVRLGLVAGAILAASALAAQPSLARAGISAGFARLDANHDSHITFAEFARTASPKVSLDLGAVPNPSAEARLSPDLRMRILREQFERMDADRNGQITWTEFRRFYSAP